MLYELKIKNSTGLLGLIDAVIKNIDAVMGITRFFPNDGI